ncbi:hypothetical protein OP281_004676 [Salmonella enterica]|nr:hypothetical protein [Salmonella enterica]EDR0972806.1 hypothetical protein [Salmonella enterica subsp. enterica serovar Thompson]EDR6726392.1 hypothetical protein [Salmonella enterica subsp. enterica]EDS8500446.1 hypothetical protein [Salmonella enterica subsp. enterica serovar Anatum]EDU3151140.1 hypothetical protein [Salmonella enterica subsp. enterica serovar Saintpaul]EDW1160128.1 hypothetical protein [Salmonella enterica subsp. enterica serovar Sundsvall]EDW2153755.1 hypothetical pro
MSKFTTSAFPLISALPSGGFVVYGADYGGIFLSIGLIVVHLKTHTSWL